jgi:hypothetical protein
MPAASTAEPTAAMPLPDDLGEPIWSERRTFPLTLFTAPLAFLAIGAIAAGPLALKLSLAAAAVGAAWLLHHNRARTVLETYTLSERFVAVESAAGSRIAIPTQHLSRVTVAGDKVRLEGRDGVVTLAFVRRQRRLLRALERVAPGVPVEHEFRPLCPT